MLEIDSLVAGYGGVPALKGVSLSVEAGEILAVLGPNGAGKTTLIKTISGVLEPISGTVRLPGGAVPDARARARRVAVVPQGGYLPRAFTVRQTVLLGRTPHLGWLGRPDPADHAAVEAALAETELDGLQDRIVGELSGGEQQRVLLARALAQDAPLLLLDEPTAHLDLRHQSGILRLVRRLAREKGLAVLVVMHDLNQAARFADRVALLVDGEFVAAGLPSHVLTEAQLSRVYGVRVRVVPAPGEENPVILLDRGEKLV